MLNHTVLKNEGRGATLVLFLEATTGFEPVVRVLQTLALPLGHVAWINQSADSYRLPGREPDYQPAGERAGDETRTRDLLLGKEAFYQLNYARKTAF